MVKNIFLAVIISFLSVFSLFSKGLPPTHDGEYHVIRFYEFAKTLSDGNIYPRWAPDLNNGFGFPLFNYVYPLPNYTAALFHLFGSSFIDAFKLNMILAVILGSIFMYLWAREFWGDLGGIVASAFYSFSPYHLADIFIRGSVGEVWALSFFPAFLWSLTKFLKTKKDFYLFLSGIFLALVIFSHNILGLMFFAFSIVYAIFLLFTLRYKPYLKVISIFLLGLLLSSIFWAPALFEKQFVRGLEIYDYSTNFPEFYQLIFPSWGAGLAGDLVNGLSFQIGAANLLVFILSFFLLLKKEYKKAVSFMIVCFLIVFFLMLKVSLPVWRIVPLMNYFQFPWRFLSLEILIVSFLAGGVSTFWKPKLLSFFLIALVILLGIGYAKPAYFMLRSDNYYTTRPNFIDGTNSPGNTFNTVWFKNQPKAGEKINLPKNEIISQDIKSTDYLFLLNLKRGKEVTVNTAYFPRWSVYVDGKKVRVEGTSTGLFKFKLEKGKHKVNVLLEDTYDRKLFTLISLTTLLFILLNMLRFVRIKR